MNENNTCIVCFKTFNESDISNFKLDCKCKICEECVYFWIVILNIENLLCIDLKANCPNDKCGKVINSDWITNNLNNDRLSVINNILLKKYLNTKEDIIKCPNSLCAYSGYFNPKIKCSKKFICEACNNMWLDSTRLNVYSQVNYYSNNFKTNFIPFLCSEYTIIKNIFTNLRQTISELSTYSYPCYVCNNYSYYYNIDDLFTFCNTCKEYNCKYCCIRRDLIHNDYLHNSNFGCNFFKVYSTFIFGLLAFIAIIFKINYYSYFYQGLFIFVVKFVLYFGTGFGFGIIIIVLLQFVYEIKEIISKKYKINNTALLYLLAFISFCCLYSVILFIQINIFYINDYIRDLSISLFNALEFIFYVLIVVTIGYCYFVIYDRIHRISSYKNKYYIYFLFFLNFVLMLFSVFILAKYLISFRNQFKIKDIDFKELYFFSAYIRINLYIGNSLIKTFLFLKQLIIPMIFLSIASISIYFYDKIRNFYTNYLSRNNLLLFGFCVLYLLLFVFIDIIKSLTYSIIDNVFIIVNILLWFILMQNWKQRNRVFKKCMTVLVILEYCNYGILSLYNK